MMSNQSPSIDQDPAFRPGLNRDPWPLLVRAGFQPRDVRCFPHKFGFNVFAVCRADT
jgi:hypothetical protein